MAIRTSGFAFYIFSGQIGVTVSMKTCLLMTVNADHTFLVMDIGGPAVFSGELRIDPSAVTEVTGLPLISFDKFMTFDEADTDTAHRRSLRVAVSA